MTLLMVVPRLQTPVDLAILRHTWIRRAHLPVLVSPTLGGCSFTSPTSFQLCAFQGYAQGEIYASCGSDTVGQVSIAGRAFDKYGNPAAAIPIFANGQFATMTDSGGGYTLLADKENGCKSGGARG